MSRRAPRQQPRPWRDEPRANAGRRDRRSVALGWFVALTIIALGGACVYFVYASHQNRDTARRWQTRADTFQRTLTARTRQLNKRTHALDRTATALHRSESDVHTLEQRQRSLANEKAQVEDARGELQVQASTLTTIANEQRDCSDGLSELLDRFAAADYAWVDANAADIGASCDQARADFDTFASQNGG